MNTVETITKAYRSIGVQLLYSGGVKSKGHGFWIRFDRWHSFEDCELNLSVLQGQATSAIAALETAAGDQRVSAGNQYIRGEISKQLYQSWVNYYRDMLTLREQMEQLIRPLEKQS